VAVADHYEVEVRRQDGDPEALAPLAPPLRRTVLRGTFCITLFWMAVLSPGFVPSHRALPVSLTFGAGGAAAMVLWLRARKSDRVRMGEYLKARLCLQCGHTFR